MPPWKDWGVRPKQAKRDIRRRSMSYFLCVLGMVLIVEGLPYFAIPEKMKVWVEKVLAAPEAHLRVMGLVMMLAGLFLVYLGRSG